jgi:predicted alpha/beta superfamily hydrolase
MKSLKPTPDGTTRETGSLRVHYPLTSGRLVLRTDPQWTHDIEAIAAADDGSWHDFQIPSDSSFKYFKPVLLDPAERWSVGANHLWLAGCAARKEVYPHFAEDERCSECELRQLTDDTGRQHQFRVFYPPGYHENTLRRYPVLYMQDGQNLFFPGEAFGNQHWRIAETLQQLDTMNSIEQVIVVGIYPSNREIDYTAPGYKAYGRFITETLKPYIDAHYRTRTDARSTAVMGSSLGGVVSFYLGWQHPDVFGSAACLSSTFGWRDNLAERVASEPRRDLRLYLDSGWPNDNFEATRHMRSLLLSRGFRSGRDLHYFSFPDAAHNEHHWAMRAHLPLQLFFESEQS